jgi:hypothetical protein
MADIDARIQNAYAEITGNESLLEMLDTDAATAMLAWGKSLAALTIQQTQDLDDAAAEEVLAPRLRAVRQTMRMAGNWAAGNYVDPASRGPLRDKLLENFRVMFGEDVKLPSAEEMDAVLNTADLKENNQAQLISKLQSLLNESDLGETDNVQKA